MTLKIGLAQIDLALGQREHNLATVQQIAEQAAQQACDLLVLPELWGSGYALEQAAELSDALDEGLFAASAELAQTHRLAICGSLLERRSDGIYNTATIYDQDGQRQAVYRKIHLIGLMDEDRYLRPGTGLGFGSAAWVNSGLAICYDLRFPELFRRYALEQARLIILPAEWPVQRIEHWRTLLKARAIENQCVVVGCNRVGSDHANSFGGHSAIIDPWGKVLVEGDEQAGLWVAQVDLDSADEARAFLPVLRDRRPEVYGAEPSAVNPRH